MVRAQRLRLGPGGIAVRHVLQRAERVVQPPLALQRPSPRERDL